jgi:hypothetical protein
VNELAIRLTQLALGMIAAYYGGLAIGRDIGRKQEREATQSLWNTWFQGVRSYTLNQFAGALSDGEHWLPSDERIKTARYLDVTNPRDK